MKLNNKASYEMSEEIALNDSELEAVHGGQGYDCSPQPPCGGGSPSYYGGGAPSYYGGGSPSYYGGSSSYAPNFGSSFSPSYGAPFDTSNCGGSSAPSYMTISYSVPVASTSSNPCGY